MSDYVALMKQALDPSLTEFARTKLELEATTLAYSEAEAENIFSQQTIDHMKQLLDADLDTVDPTRVIIGLQEIVRFYVKGMKLLGDPNADVDDLHRLTEESLARVKTNLPMDEENDS